MADWRQIQARIRKAKAAPDSTAQLSELYGRTRDAMVAYELAKAHEKAGESAEAVRWYTTAYERFRRAQWRSKAQEALTRLGAPIPEASSLAADAEAEGKAGEPRGAEPAAATWEERQPQLFATAGGESVGEVAPAGEAETQPAQGEGKSTEAGKRPRRRGHRGGRGRRRGKKGQTAPTTAAAVERTTPEVQPREGNERPPVEMVAPGPSRRWEDHEAPAFTGETPAREREEEPAPARAGTQIRGRAGDPGLSSRMAQLESQLRRLLASNLYRMGDADQAPAGPGVFLVTDTEQTSYYHVEACQTLRIGVANLLRVDRRAPRGAETLRSKFADDLGITESQVGKYVEKHCAVRWLQLDEGAPALAHFAIAVLRPVLDES